MLYIYNKQRIQLGTFKTEDEAVKARNKYIIDNKLNAKVQVVEKETPKEPEPEPEMTVVIIE